LERSYAGQDIAEAKQSTACAAAGRGACSPHRTWRALQNNGSSLLLPGLAGLRAARREVGRLRLAGSDRLVQRSVVQGEVNPTRTEAPQKAMPLGPELAESLLRLKSRTFYRAETDWVYAGDNGKPRWQGIMLTDHVSLPPSALESARSDGTPYVTRTRRCCTSWVPPCRPEGVAAPLRSSDHYEYLQSGGKWNEETSGREGSEYFDWKKGA
jgi:hypothetical protein